MFKGCLIVATLATLSICTEVFPSSPITLNIVSAINFQPLSRILKEGDSILVPRHGYTKLYMNPYKSISAIAFQCSIFKVDKLHRSGDGVAAAFSAKNIVGCPVKARVEIYSTLLSKNSGVNFEIGNRKIVLRGTAIAVQQDKDSVTIGVEKGSVDVNYVESTTHITPNYFVRSEDGKRLGKPQISPAPYLIPSYASSGKFKGCTDSNNTIYSTSLDTPYKLNNQLCTEGYASDIFTVINPSNKRLDYKISKPNND